MARIFIFFILVIASCRNLRSTRYFYVTEESCEYVKLDLSKVDSLISSEKDIAKIEKIVRSNDLSVQPTYELWLTSYVEGYPKKYDSTNVLYLRDNESYFAKINHVELKVSFTKIEDSISQQIILLVKENKPIFYERECEGIDDGGREIFYVVKNGKVVSYFGTSLEGGAAMDDSFTITNEWSKVIDLILKL